MHREMKKIGGSGEEKRGQGHWWAVYCLLGTLQLVIRKKEKDEKPRRQEEDYMTVLITDKKLLNEQGFITIGDFYPYI